MKRLKDINWYLADPVRLTEMKPFTRGGKAAYLDWGTSKLNTNVKVRPSNITYQNISPDVFLTEYDPSLHHIILNKSIPHIKVRIDGTELPFQDITLTASYQKNIHALHTLHLGGNPLEFTMCDVDAQGGGVKLFDKIKQEWAIRNLESDKYEVLSKCLKCSTVGLLFYYDKDENKYGTRVFSYDEGYQIVPNYDEFGIEIARSLVYFINGSLVIDTYTHDKHYRIVQKEKADEKTAESWEVEEEVHGFSHIPLLYKRQKVAWEYAQSAIEMWEIMANINAIALKRFGTFALVFVGEMDSDSFKRDSQTLVINLSSNSADGKQDAKVLNFPEPQTMDAYLDNLENKIGIWSSTTFISPKDIAKTGSGGDGIALAMRSDIALAKQSAVDWKRFMNEMMTLHKEGLDLETNGTEKYSKLFIDTKINPWSMETNSTRINNLSTEGKWLSRKTLIERSPDAAPDEYKRVQQELEDEFERLKEKAIQDADDKNLGRKGKQHQNTFE